MAGNTLVWETELRRLAADSHTLSVHCSDSVPPPPLPHCPTVPLSLILLYSLPVLQKSAHRGVFVLTMQYLLHLWRYRIRQQNPVLSVFCPVPDDLLSITRPQRIACMCLELMVSFDSTPCAEVVHRTGVIGRENEAVLPELS